MAALRRLTRRALSVWGTTDYCGRLHRTIPFRPYPVVVWTVSRHASGASAHQKTSAYHRRHGKSPRRGDQPLPPPAPNNPVDWFPWGARRPRAGKLLDRPIFLSIGYAACHWCHVMERESFETRADGALPERPVRGDQGRPRGAPRPRSGLHVGRPGDDRRRWLADVGLPHPRGPSVLRRNLLPRRAAPRDAVVPPGARGRRPCLARAARRRRGGRWTAGPGVASSNLASRRGSHDPTPDLLAAAAGAIEASFDAANGGWGRAPKFPQPMTIEFLLRHHLATGDPRSLLVARRSLDGDGRRRGARPARRRLPSIFDGRALAGAALRADALRQRPARAGLPARLGAHRRPGRCSRSRPERSTT